MVAVGHVAVRRSARGAAMVEAIVVIPTRLIIFAGLVFCWRLYSEKLVVMATTRLDVWAYAGTNCGQPGDLGPGDVGSVAGASGAGQVAGSMGNGNNGATPANIAQAQHVLHGSASDVHADTLTKGLDTGAASAQGVVVPSPFLGFRGDVPVAAKITVMCNEPPYNASFLDMVRAAFDNLK